MRSEFGQWEKARVDDLSCRLAKCWFPSIPSIGSLQTCCPIESIQQIGLKASMSEIAPTAATEANNATEPSTPKPKTQGQPFEKHSIGQYAQICWVSASNSYGHSLLIHVLCLSSFDRSDRVFRILRLRQVDDIVALCGANQSVAW